MAEEEIVSPIFLLASEYKEDLDKLREIDIDRAVLTPMELQRLQIMCKKYGLDMEVNKENFAGVLGEISTIIRKKLERFTIEDFMERTREKELTKKPKKKREKTESVKKVI